MWDWVLENAPRPRSYQKVKAHAYQTLGYQIVSYGSMAAATLQRADMCLQAMRQDGERRLVRQKMAVGTGDIGAGWSPETRELALLNLLASVSYLVKLFENTVREYE